MSLLDTASLIVTPNGYKEGKLYSVIPSDGSGDLSVTRATTATRVNSAGLVELVPYNLVQYSEDFANGYWINYQSSETSNNTTAPNGTLTADKLTQTGVGGGSIYTTGLSLTGIMTLSCYFKAGSIDEVIMDSAGTSAYWGVRFNLTTQAITYFGVGANATITSVGNGWYRCSVSANVTGTNYVAFGLVGAVNDYVYLWGAQLNEGTLKDYQKTETRLNIPRLNYSNGTCPSILVEPQRTNSFTWSEKLLVGYAFAYTSGTFTVTENTTETLDPFGNNNADKFTTAASSVNHNDSYNTSNGSGNMTLSIFAKKGIGTAINLYEYNVLSGIGFATTFDIENGTIISTWGSLVSNSIEDYGNGWYRCSITGPDTSAAGNIHRVTTFEGQTYLFGWQLELNASYATSYIPTTSASVTRNADVISKTGISSLIGQTEGTIFCEINFDINVNTTGSSRIQLSDGTTTNWIFIGIPDGLSGNLIRMFCNSPSGTMSEFTSSPIANGVNKIAFAYKSGSFVLYVNGTQAASSSSSITIPTCTRIDLQGQTPNQSAFERINYNSAALWKTRLTNTQLAQLTTI